MTDPDPILAAIAERYRRFADVEARGRSPLYEELALGVAGDRMALRFLAALPPAKRQPNLLLAAARQAAGLASGWPELRRILDRDGGRIADVMRSRRTQTNEPARCATLLPVLAGLPAPLALIEAGASAGLCLLPDLYAYDYDGTFVAPTAPGDGPAPVFRCSADPATPVPERNVQVVWRAGIDLEPIDVTDEAEVAWLETLVWPGEGARLELLRRAVEAARRRPPEVRRGDLLAGLPSLMDEAPEDATLVVFHSAVLPYLSAGERACLRRLLGGRPCAWIANEPADLQPGASGRAGQASADDYLLTLNERPVAWTDPHGTRIHWVAQVADEELAAPLA